MAAIYYDGSRVPSKEAGQSTDLLSASQAKRNLWWKAFRKTVLEPHSITVLDNTMIDKVPAEILRLVETNCQDLQKYTSRALTFVEALSRDGSIGVSIESIFPKLREHPQMRGCQESTLNEHILPSQEDQMNMPLFDLPRTQLDLAVGFSESAFTIREHEQMPPWFRIATDITNHLESRTNSGEMVCGPFLIFEKAHGGERHEIEAAMNYCAMSGSAALNAFKSLYAAAWLEERPRVKSPVVFSCILDKDVGIINHHWAAAGGYFVAPVSKFDLRDTKDVTHFFAWLEAIQDWATGFLLPNVQKALITCDRQKRASTETTPISANSDNGDSFNQSMRLIFENKPRKGERGKSMPLSVTSTMRMKSPRAAAEPETVVTPINLNHARPTDAKKLDTGTSAPVSRPEVVASPRYPTTLSIPIPPPIPNPTTWEDSTLTAQPPDTTQHAPQKKKSLRILSPLNRSSGVKSPPASSKETRPITASAVSPQPVKSATAAVQTRSFSRPGSSKSPGLLTGTSQMRSPAYSISSVSSKKSFSSLWRSKQNRSPTTPDFGTSPKGGLFKSRTGNGFDTLRENKSKQSRSDNAAPLCTEPLPTPAYDKKRFDIKTPKPVLPEGVHPALEDGPLKGQSLDHMMSQSPATDAYHAARPLPLRQWAVSPKSTTTFTTTITAGG